MKTPLAVLLPFVLCTGVLLGQPAGNAANAAANARSPGELAALDQFLELSDADLAQMEQIIVRLRAMTPAERTKLRAEITAFRQLPEPERRRLRQGWGAMPPDIQNGWREMMQSASPERRAAIQAQMQSLPPEEKMAYRRSLVEAYLKTKSARP